VVGDVSIDINTFFVTNFMNLKIKPYKSFKNAHRGMVSMHVLIGISTRMCEYLRLYCVLKKIFLIKCHMKIHKNIIKTHIENTTNNLCAKFQFIMSFV
jgi:hypothetical protein